MITRSENCPRREVNVRSGKGLVQIKDLAGGDELYQHGRMFAHITVESGCSIGYHDHVDETEFYYILKGDPVFNDNGTLVSLHPGDLCSTGYGQSHGLENQSDAPVELIALIVMK
ncbi:MAG: cupin domain-containing protein [Oscillibacter sp.]